MEKPTLFGKMKRKLFRIGIVTAVFVVGLAILSAIPGPIEGRWRSSACRCLCGSYSFLELTDGTISLYSSNHGSMILGRYEPVERGRYRLEYEEINGVKEWTVKPTLLFLHILDDDLTDVGPRTFLTTLNWRILFRRESDEVKRDNLAKANADPAGKPNLPSRP